MPAEEIIITDEKDGILTSWQKLEGRWYQIRANEHEVLSVIESPFKDARPPFILQMSFIDPRMLIITKGESQ